jgi:hypothetical protein
MHLLRRSATLGALALLAALVCSSCSSTPSAAAVGQQYLTIVAHTNAALTKDRSTNAAKSDDKYGQTFGQAANQIRALTFPASAQKDAQDVIAALAKMSTQAAAVGKAAAKNQKVLANVTAMAHQNLKLIDEETVEKKASDALRRDLSLPQETTTTTTTTTAPAVLNAPKG